MAYGSHELISVIIPVYNREKYIEQALDSILSDSYPNKEIVLIDDGSRDKTTPVIEAWIARHGHEIHVVFKSRENRGVNATLNECIALTKGQYIVLLDSDDYLVEGGIQKRYDYLKQHPDKMMVFGDCLLMDSESRITAPSALVAIGNVKKEELTDDASIQKFAILNGFTTGSTMMVNRRIYDTDVIGPYDPKLHSQDYIYHLRVAAKNMLGFIDETVSAYRIHDNNMSVSYTQAKVCIENLFAMLAAIPEFKGIPFKIYLLANSMREVIRIPYLFIKYTLMNILKDNSDSPAFLRATAKGLLALLTGVKRAVNGLLARIYLKEYS